eukprot:TRINITY_DN11312_c0_g1_i1.p2 TRINITY_DN11312_c0_g1~~TRINITY_DN11312_c0_g1_i1.p2  ORF type:complete len:280 (+),score=85.32 TRINITY_DN11312_c0_g1_i1:1284-2123(+)
MHKRKREVDESKREVGRKLQTWKKRFEEEFERPPKVEDLEREEYKFVKKLRMEFEELKKECSKPVLKDLSEAEVRDIHDRHKNKADKWRQWLLRFRSEFKRDPTHEDFALPAYQAAAKLKEDVGLLESQAAQYPLPGQVEPKQRLTFTKAVLPKASSAVVNRVTEGEHEECEDVEGQEGGAEGGEEEWAEEEAEEETAEDGNDCDVSGIVFEFNPSATMKLPEGFKWGGNTNSSTSGAEKPKPAKPADGGMFSFNMGSMERLTKPSAKPSEGGMFKFTP